MVLQSGSPVKKLMDDYAKHMRENLICLLHCDLVDSSAQYLNYFLEILYFGLITSKNSNAKLAALGHYEKKNPKYIVGSKRISDIRDQLYLIKLQIWIKMSLFALWAYSYNNFHKL